MTKRGVEMKLKRVDRDEWQKCCRYCHYYQNGKCYKNIVSTEETAPVWKVAEEGHVSEVIEETLGSVKLTPFRELEYKLREWKISEKRIAEFNSLFKECYDQWVQEVKPELDVAIDKCYQNHINDHAFDSGVYIEDPERFCCKEWC